MSIRAVFENGVFRPMEQVSFTEGSVVGLSVIRAPFHPNTATKKTRP
jgi:predicted DNA-binding antitoxin AbrB/MazE fold protein